MLITLCINVQIEINNVNVVYSYICKDIVVVFLLGVVGCSTGSVWYGMVCMYVYSWRLHGFPVPSALTLNNSYEATSILLV